MNLQNLPIGIQTFEKIITDNYLYVDKTEIIYNIANTGNVYFLSRPRRFGKSLLCSTFKAYFEGKKELFKGLAIENLEKNWIEYPVLHISFAGIKDITVENLESYITNMYLKNWESIYGKKEDTNKINERFKNIIEATFQKTGKQVAIIIDEYDAPILNTLDNKELCQDVKVVLQNFFSPLKDADPYIKFLFITGITKFSQLSIFSTLNNIENISMLPQYSALCGITQQELESKFKKRIEQLAVNNKETYQEALSHLKRQYDGYHFSSSSEDIYNPFSLLHVLKNGIYDNYWFATGTPTFLIKLLKQYEINYNSLDGIKVSSDAFDKSTDDISDAIPVFYQAGYLTIKDYDFDFMEYTLGFPNKEVKVGFSKSLIPYYLGITGTENDYYVLNIIKNLQNGEIDIAMKRLKAFFAAICYDLIPSINQREKYYQGVIYLIFTLLGQFPHTEMRTARGRSDLLLRTRGYLYIFEFKLYSTALKAVEQIDEMGYIEPFEAGDYTTVKVGVKFNLDSKEMEEWVVG